jgi:hypothetical protein
VAHICPVVGKCGSFPDVTDTGLNVELRRASGQALDALGDRRMGGEQVCQVQSAGAEKRLHDEQMRG